jgi:MFS family permease
MALFRNRSYKLLLSATAVSNLGDGVSALAFPWLATLITRDPVLIALVAFATRLPWFLMSIPAGAIVDRSDRQKLVLRADWLRMALTVAVIGLILTIPAFPPLSGEMFYILILSGFAFLLGTAEVLRDNAAQTLLPSVVEKDQLETANGQLWTAEQVMGQFVGPPLAGFLIALAVPAPFILDALTFAVAALAVAAMQLKQRDIPPRRPMREDLAEGWAWMRAHPMVLRVAVMLGVMNGASLLGLTMLVLISQERLGLSAFGFGMIMTAGAAGGVTGGLLGPKLIARIGRVAALKLALALFPIAFVAIALTASPYVVAVALFFESLAALLWNIVTVSWRQRIIPDDLLGRVNSIYRFFGWGLTPVGALAGGVIVAASEGALGRDQALQLPYLVGAIILTGVAIYGWRKLDL